MSEMKLPLIEKYRVSKFEDIKGQDIVISEVDNFYKRFPQKRALILNGPVGTGKTSLAIALANEYNLELFELNASDLRNRSSLDEVLKPALAQVSLFKKSKLILMDEADGISASDRGGLPLLISLIGETSFPIIITANDIWHKKFSSLRKKCQIISLKELKDKEVSSIVKDVLKRESEEIGGGEEGEEGKVSVSDETVGLIVKQARGDVRAALNDLQSVFDLGEEKASLEISEREKQESIFEALRKVFQEETDEKILGVFDNTGLNLDEVLLWVEENLPLEYQGKGLEQAFNSLSKADIFKGRIYRQQYWRFLVYKSFFLTAGISSATKLKNKRFVSYKRPSRILKIWLANQKNAKMKGIISKYASFCHMSKKKANKEKFLLPFILDGLDEKTKRKLDFEEKEEDYLKEKKVDIIISSGMNKFKN